MVEDVTIYRTPTTEADADALADWLADRVTASVTVRDRFLSVFADDDLPEAFCDDEQCQLYNPHRQPGVVAAQLRETECCPRHAARYRP